MIVYKKKGVRRNVPYTGWKLSKYGVISGPYFPVFGLNTGKHGPEITPYLDTFHTVLVYAVSLKNVFTVEIGNCHSRTSRPWHYLISSQVLYGCTLNTDFLFDNRYWHVVALRYKRYLVPCIWSILDTLKVMLSRMWQEFCRPSDDSALTHNGIFDTI